MEEAARGREQGCLQWATQSTGIGQLQDSPGVLDSELWEDRPQGAHSPGGGGGIRAWGRVGATRHSSPSTTPHATSLGTL